MLLPSAPTAVKNRFVKTLQEIVDEDRLNSLKRYFDSLTRDIESNSAPFRYDSISDRVETSRYFYFPTETTIQSMNCFERSASLYFAFQELYPKSNPALIFLTDKNNTMHAALLFIHDNELWGADPTRQYFDRVAIEPEKMIIKSDTPKEIEFEDISTVSSDVLEDIAKNLRSRRGVVDFFYESGQRASYFNQIEHHQSLFIKVKKDGKIISEIRLFSDGPEEKNSCIRFTSDPSTGASGVEYLRYSGEHWGTLFGQEIEEPVIDSPYKNVKNIASTTHSTQFRDVAYYLSKGKSQHVTLEELTRFSKDPRVATKFEQPLELARKIGVSTYFDFIKYLKIRHGSPDNIVSSIKEGVYDSLGSLHNFASEIVEGCYLQLVPPFLKFAEDQKRYAAEVARQMTEKQP